MAVFGLPRMHEDDALRAVRAAAEMRAAPTELNVTLQAGFGVVLENRTGVNTGEVVTGDTGDSQRLATGDTVDVAARLEQAAPTGEVLIGVSTYRLVRDAVEVVPVEPLNLKGKPEPVPAYRLMSAAAWKENPASRPALRRPNARDRRPWRRVPPFGRRTRGAARHAARPCRGRQEPVIEEFVRSVAGRGGGPARPLPVLRRRHHVLAPGRGVAAGRRNRAGRQRGGRPHQAQQPALVRSLPTRPAASSQGMGLSQHQYGKDELFWAVRVILPELAQPRAACHRLRGHPLGGGNVPRPG